MKKLKFEWYVLNHNFNRKKVEMFNIFNNILVNDYTNKLCVDYKRKKMTFDEFVKELDGIIRWQEWSRCEYEIAVGGLFHHSKEDLEKWDCYQQAEPNMRIIAKYVLESYYPNLKIKLDVDEIKEDYYEKNRTAHS